MAPADSEANRAAKPAGFPVPGGSFVFRLGPALMAAFMLLILLGLGFWQIERLHWKEDLIATIKTRMQEPPTDLNLSTIPDNATDMDYRPASASGLFQHDKELYLNAISLKGEGGYHVLTPLTFDDGRVMLIDRGWVPYNAKDPKTRQDGQLMGPVTVTGILRVPHGHRFMQPDNNPGKNDWYWIDLKAMAQAAGVKEFLPYVLEANDAYNPGGYPVGGQTQLDLPNNHLGYAVTWFSLAFVLLVVFGVFSWRREQKPEATENKEKAEE